MHQQPLISIITATYNRSNILAYAIKSVMTSTYKNWELLIVGDACTDDTEQVANSFNDQRIHFKNLKENIGEQSGPNNEGFKLSKGDYIAYLNHDDMWFPDHLEKLLAAMLEHDADQVSNLVCTIEEDSKPYLRGAPEAYKTEPYHWTPASAWLVRRNFLESLGHWRFFRESYAFPSHDLIFRAWKAGKKLVVNPELTVLAVPSSRRNAAYAKREYEINEYYFQMLENNHEALRARLLTEMTLMTNAKVRTIPVRTVILRKIKNLLIKILFKLKQNPYGFYNFLFYRKKGGYVDFIRKNRGLSKKE